MLVEGYHIKAVGCDIVGGRQHRPDIEQHQCGNERPNGTAYASRQRKRQCHETHRHSRLHDQYPPSFCLEYVHQRTPEWFDYPRQIQQRSESRQRSIVHPQPLEQGNRYHVHEEIRYSFEEIEGGHPGPGAGLAFTHPPKLFVNRYNSARVSRRRSCPRRPFRRRQSGTGPLRVPSRVRGGCMCRPPM